jgi:hypothetical protein
MRSFNYTGRKKILRKDFALGIYTNDKDDIYFEVNLPDFMALGYCPKSKIFVEAYRKAGYMRFDYGTVANNKEFDGYLSEFDDPDDIYFRIKVISEEGKKLEGVADRIRPEIEKQTDLSIINVRVVDLSGAIWSIEYSDENPTILLDKSFSKMTIHSDVKFKTIILPSVLREILTRILLIEKDFSIDFDDVEGDWRNRWMYFCKETLGSAFTQEDIENMDEDKKFNWIDETVARFCRYNKFKESLKQEIKEESI